MSARRILVIEDDRDMRKMLRVTLEDEGYVVTEAADGRTALKLASESTWDLIIQDVILPDVPGFELVRQIRAYTGNAHVPIIALSGFEETLREAWFEHAGYTSYLVKPVDPDALAKVISSLLPPPVPEGAGG